jgi:hypothetical protein
MGKDIPPKKLPSHSEKRLSKGKKRPTTSAMSTHIDVFDKDEG